MSREHTNRETSQLSSQMIEALEPRQLLTVTVAGGNLDIQGTYADDTITLYLQPGNKNTLVISEDDGTANPQLTYMDLRQLTLDVRLIMITGDMGNDAIIVNQRYGRIRLSLYVDGGMGDDTIITGDGNDYIQGGEGADVISGGAGADRIDGGLDNDTISGAAGNDYITGDEGDDSLIGSSGHDTIYGNNGMDTLLGGSGDDYLDAGDGDDVLSGGLGYDTLYAGRGDDLATGDGDNDFVFGGEGNDTLTGDDGNDQIFGEVGDDDLEGGGGNDSISGGGGNDSVWGDAGKDTFYISRASYQVYDYNRRGGDRVGKFKSLINSPNGLKPSVKKLARLKLRRL